jgi:hypothetical protein
VRQVLDDPNLTKATSINDIPLFATSPRRARNTRDDRLSGGRHRRYDASSRCSIVNRPSREAPDDHHVSRPGHSMASTLAVPRPLASVQRQSRSLWGGSRRRGASIGSMSLPAPRRRSPDFCQWVRKNSRIGEGQSGGHGTCLQLPLTLTGSQKETPPPAISFTFLQGCDGICRGAPTSALMAVSLSGTILWGTTRTDRSLGLVICIQNSPSAGSVGQP